MMERLNEAALDFHIRRAARSGYHRLICRTYIKRPSALSIALKIAMAGICLYWLFSAVGNISAGIEHNDYIPVLASGVYVVVWFVISRFVFPNIPFLKQRKSHEYEIYMPTLSFDMVLPELVERYRDGGFEIDTNIDNVYRSDDVIQFSWLLQEEAENIYRFDDDSMVNAYEHGVSATDIMA